MYVQVFWMSQETGSYICDFSYTQQEQSLHSSGAVKFVGFVVIARTCPPHSEKTLCHLLVFNPCRTGPDFSLIPVITDLPSIVSSFFTSYVALIAM